MNKHPILMGTLILTVTGFLSRILGFFYRIFLSRAIGAEGLGLYQMIFPVHGIAFALCAGSIQTAISQLVASGARRGREALRTGLFISLSIAAALTASIFCFHDALAEYFLLEPACGPLLPVMALSIPFCAVHACICGYYYGLRKARVPAVSQLVEQVIRIFFVFLVADIYSEQGKEVTVALAVWAMVIGEAASAVYSLLVYGLTAGNGKGSPATDPAEDRPSGFSAMAPALMALAFPLMGNRLVLNLLQSLEAVFIPDRLNMFGLTGSEALSVYGVLTGMALPFILFPSAITNSLSVMLLPAVAEAQALGNGARIRRTIAMALRYSLYMGILCIGVFTIFGDSLGRIVFHNASAGDFITTLAWLCPFMYLATTMGSVLNGLGETRLTFVHNVLALLLRLAFVVFLIPRHGILAYLWGMLASELFLALLHMSALGKQVGFPLDAVSMIVKPGVCLVISVGILYALAPAWRDLSRAVEVEFVVPGAQIAVLTAVYGGLLGLRHRPEPSEP